MPFVDLVAVVLVAGTGWALGRSVLDRLIDGDEAGWALSTALGLGLLAQGAFLLGLAGLLSRPWLLGLLLAVNVGCSPAWRAAAAGTRVWLQAPSRRQLQLAAVTVVALLPIVLLALYPPMGWDSGNYHLPYVESFEREGGLTFLPSVRFPVFPQTVELLFLLALQLGSVVSAKLIHMLMTLLVAGVLWSWGRSLSLRLAGLFAAALWMGNPEVVWLGSLAYVDNGLALFVVASVWAWHQSARNTSAPDRGRGWLIVSGVLVGLAAATKYLGLFFVAILGVATVMRALKQRRPLDCVWFGLSAAVIAAPCYVRLFVLTGSPLFPFYPQWFGSSAWTPAEAVPSEPLLERIGASLLFLAKVPWNTLFERAIFNYQAPLSPYYLVLLPLCLFLALRRRWSAALIGLSTLYGLFWLTSVRDIRFLMPSLALMTLALSAPLARLVELLGQRLGQRFESWFDPRWLSWLVVAGLLVPGPLYACYKMWKWRPLPFSEQGRVASLRRNLPGYAELDRLNQQCGSDYTVYALFAPYLRYHAKGELLGERTGPHRFRDLLEVAHDGGALYRALERFGVDYLLVRSTRAFKWTEERGDAFEQHFRQLPASEGFFLYELGDFR